MRGGTRERERERELLIGTPHPWNPPLKSKPKRCRGEGCVRDGWGMRGLTGGIGGIPHARSWKTLMSFLLRSGLGLPANFSSLIPYPFCPPSHPLLFYVCIISFCYSGLGKYRAGSTPCQEVSGFHCMHNLSARTPKRENE